MKKVEINGQKISVDKYNDVTKLTGEGAKIITAELLAELHDKLYYTPILGNVELPETIKICEDAFRGEKIFSLYAPKLIEIEDRAFNNCRELEHVHAPKVTDIGDWGFGGCIRLTWGYFPELVTVGEKTFYCCISLSDFYSPKLKEIGKDAFRECQKL